ncbi:MAG: ABC transporter permease [Desulfosarcinaceae bacterium]
MSLSYLLNRLGLMALTLLCATFVTFVMLRMTPGDPAELILQKVFVGTEDYTADAGAKARIEERYGLNRPLYLQYGAWLSQAFRGDFGYSFRSGQRVTEEIGLRIRPTLVLSVAALGLSLVLTVIFGALTALARAPLLRAMLDTVIVSSIAVPNFYLALILVLVFGVWLNVLPVSGYGGPSHFVLPVVTLALTLFGYTTTILNDAVANVREQGFVLTARGKGLGPLTIFRRHVLRNALVPVVPYVALQLGYVLGGVVVVETVFAWPGIGNYLMDSIQTRDVPAIEACIAFIALAFSSANLLADLAVFLLDPRARVGS